LGLGHGGAGQLAEFVDDLVAGRERVLATARCLAGFALDRAVTQMHVDPHHVPELRAARRDRGVLDHLDLARQFDALRIGHGGFGELVDKAITFEEERRHAIG
jgi:hypothetical protein